jgi:hypothetical protein
MWDSCILLLGCKPKCQICPIYNLRVFQGEVSLVNGKLVDLSCVCSCLTLPELSLQARKPKYINELYSKARKTKYLWALQ